MIDSECCCASLLRLHIIVENASRLATQSLHQATVSSSDHAKEREAGGAVILVVGGAAQRAVDSRRPHQGAELSERNSLRPTKLGTFKKEWLKVHSFDEVHANRACVRMNQNRQSTDLRLE